MRPNANGFVWSTLLMCSRVPQQPQRLRVITFFARARQTGNGIGPDPCLLRPVVKQTAPCICRLVSASRTSIEPRKPAESSKPPQLRRNMINVCTTLLVITCPTPHPQTSDGGLCTPNHANRTPGRHPDHFDYRSSSGRAGAIASATAARKEGFRTCP